MTEPAIGDSEIARRWMLPDGVQEVLAPDSWRLEGARRALLDLYWRWGFDLIRPPLIEYLDSLLTGAGADLDLQTFKLTDQASGRLMGIRSDMTTQASRIDAHRANDERPARYCYIGSVLRTRAEEPGGSRAPLQIGVEKFGDAGLAADFEVMSLMLESLRLMGIDSACVDLGHVQVYRRLVERAGLHPDLERYVFDIVQRKSHPDLNALAAEDRLQPALHDYLSRLIDLNGDRSVIATAKRMLGGIDAQIDAAITALADIADRLAANYPGVSLFVDFAELRGYRYKTGLIFGAFAPGLGRELARGGRYDGVGASFGRARPATGFSADLNVLTALVPDNTGLPGGIQAPLAGDPALVDAIRRLRAAGERVVIDDADARSAGCDRALRKTTDGWQVQPLAG